MDGYKITTRARTSGLAIYAMSSIITDRTEPSEALQAAASYDSARL
ncbi:MAG: hypothetical protein ACOCYB_08970 [Alkalispirochaeta sp.]